MLFEDLQQIVKKWLSFLESYTDNQLYLQPATNSWSIGQLYMHLAKASSYFLDQAFLCLKHNDNADLSMADEANIFFAQNELPNVFIEGPPSNALTPQPKNREHIIIEMNLLLQRIAEIKELFSLPHENGKTRHMGLEYFNAQEWIQFCEMHLRHHLHQKERIDVFLKSQ